MAERDLAELRRRVAGKQGKQLWRTLDELADSDEFAELIARELPSAESLLEVDRRQFLKLMGASLALAGLGACTRQPVEKIVPYVKPPDGVVLGEPLYFATAMPLAGVATGLLVRSNEGRPTKVEGNPQHPGSLGATDPFCQASVLTLYDPDRSSVIRSIGEIRTWGAFLDAARSALDGLKTRGAGLRILSETVTSPTLAEQIRAFLAAYPGARWHQYEPAGRDGARAGARFAFGEPVETLYRFDRADVVFALDADVVGCGPGHLRYLRDFMTRRRDPGGARGMNRLYVAETTPTSTGSIADHRFRVRAGEIEDVTRALARAVGVPVASRAGAPAAAPVWLEAVVRDLSAHRGSSIVVAGEEQPASVHALVHAINQALGNAARTVVYTDPLDPEPVIQLNSLAELVRDMDQATVAMLVILGGNPVFTAPADFAFADRLAKVPLRVRLGLYDDETSNLCHWHVPEAHFLESWGDARAYDGTVSIIQPLIAPLYGGKSAYELLSALADPTERSGYDIVRAHWQKIRGGGDFERFWRKALNDGVVPDTALRPKPVRLRVDWTKLETAGPDPELLRRAALSGNGAARADSSASAGAAQPERAAAAAVEVVFRPDPTVFDGRFANNGWLQELPKPATKLTWDNAALLSPATAARIGIASEDVIEIHRAGRSVRAPVWVLPGQADDSITLALGYGRTLSGNVGTGVGFDAYPLRTSDAPSFAVDVEIRKTGDHHPLACTQRHHGLVGRPIIRAASLEQYRKNPSFAHELGENPGRDDTLYANWPYDGTQWGMAIDLNACVGCNACVVACVAENNIPVVGKDQVMLGREMQWIRIDRYYEGPPDDPTTYQQPMLCQHCETAPCEVVCPVNATNHSSDGLNQMVYNRCVGTRYCSNNCPYKVRRFNFLLYSDWTTESLKLQRNPEVTVRSRGVMEKCTYCVQRIETAKITAQKEGRAVREGEVVTACQQACPAEAIVFGNINDPESHVARLRRDPRNYSVLADLNTRPRTTYLAAVRNPNPDLGAAQTGEGEARS